MEASRELDRPKRPAYVAAVLIVLGATGLERAIDGALTLDVLRHPDLARQIVARISDANAARLYEAWFGAVVDAHRTTLPIGVAALLLGGLLSVCAATTFLSSGRTLRWLWQAMAATALFATIAHAAVAPVRTDALGRFRELLAADRSLAPEDAEQLARAWAGTFSVKLALQLGVLALGTFALTRPRARAFFAASARREPGVRQG